MSDFAKRISSVIYIYAMLTPPNNQKLHEIGFAKPATFGVKGILLPLVQLILFVQFSTLSLVASFCWWLYSQQQNKWYPKGFNLPILKLHSIISSKWASKDLWGFHLFCCWLYTSVRCNDLQRLLVSLQ